MAINFFLLTGVISKKDSQLIERPKSNFGIEQNVDKKSMIFLIDQENQIYFNDEKINASKCIKEDLTKESKDIIYELFKKDFDYFNYKK